MSNETGLLFIWYLFLITCLNISGKKTTNSMIKICINFFSKTISEHFSYT
jgi:hypothetical protein